MENAEYNNIVRFILSDCKEYPEAFQDKKSNKTKRDTFKCKAKKFFLKGNDLYRFVPGIIDGVKVVKKGDILAILEEFHRSAFGRHSGVNKTSEAIKTRYWWYGLTDDVKSYVRDCEACQKSDPLKPAKRSELCPIKVSAPFEMVGVDLVGPLMETSDGNKYIFTATDYFTKWVEAYAIPSKCASDISRCFKKLFSRHGAVNAILTNEGHKFLNEINEKLCRDWNIKHIVSAAYHPQTNGLDERTNQTLKTTLRKLVSDHQDDWDNQLDAALFAIRTKPQSSTKFSPFFLLYGREARYPSQLPKDFSESDSSQCLPSEEAVASHVNSRAVDTASTTETVKKNISVAQEKQKVDYQRRNEKKRKFTDFQVGDKKIKYISLLGNPSVMQKRRV